MFKHIVLWTMALTFLMSGISFAEKRVIEINTDNMSGDVVKYI